MRSLRIASALLCLLAMGAVCAAPSAGALTPRSHRAGPHHRTTPHHRAKLNHPARVRRHDGRRERAGRRAVTRAAAHLRTRRPAAVAAPTVSGRPETGATLLLSAGSWSRRPTRYREAWRACDAAGTECTAVPGARGATIAVTDAFVGDTLRGVVYATNAAGTTKSRSASTGVVAAAPSSTGSTTGTTTTTRTTTTPAPTTPTRTHTTATTGTTAAPTTTTPPLRTTGCFASPVGCGYPDAAAGNVGAGDCSALPAWSPADLPSDSYRRSGNEIAITGNDVTISGYDIGNYFFYVQGRDFTLDHDCISFNGSNWAGGQDSATSIWGTHSATDLTVANSTIVPPGCTASSAPCTGSGVNETLVTSGGAANATIDHDVLAGAVEPINGVGPGSVIHGSYIVANGILSGAHTEDIYEADTSAVTIDHNTLLNPMDQTAVIFGDSSGDGACDNGFDITDNLMAGGGYILYACAHATTPGSSSLAFTGNDIARCDGVPTYDPSLGGRSCGPASPLSTQGAAFGSGADSHGFWPQGAYFGLTQSTWCTGGETTWSGNFYDDTGATIPCT